MQLWFCFFISIFIAILVVQLQRFIKCHWQSAYSELEDCIHCIQFVQGYRTWLTVCSSCNGNRSRQFYHFSLFM